MTAFIKNVGCECAPCAPAPCDNPCCTFNVTNQTLSGDSETFTYDVTGQFAIAHTVFLTAEWEDPDAPAATVRFQVQANGVDVYDSGTQGPAYFFVDTSFNVSAGTTEIKFIVTPSGQSPAASGLLADLDC